MRALPLIAIALALCACGDEATPDRGGQIVATTTQAADLARNVTGEVRSLVPPGADPHDYELRPDDLAALAEADWVVRSGGELDAWLEDAIENSGFDGRLVDLSGSAGEDPHWWHDASAAAGAAHLIAKVFGHDASAYESRIERLDAAISRCAGRVPRSRRVLVTTHDALGPFARRYGFTVVGTVIPSNSTQAQPSSAGLARLVEDVRKAGVTTIFPETAVSADVEKRIAEEAGVEVGEALYVDSLGPKGSPGDTYLKAMAFNARAILASVGVDCEL
jgi:ABC-type Zn uptake system ZnuABC Zn-binding protein ZnuA